MKLAKLNKKAEDIFRKLIARKNESAASAAIQIPGLLRFSFETFDSYKCGAFTARLWSLAFWGECCGDAMRDPEVCFAVNESGVYPYLYRNDWACYTKECIIESCILNADFWQRDITKFANEWMIELEEYGMLTAPVEQAAPSPDVLVINLPAKP